jgi:serine O-acetyltransferase
MFNPSFSWWLSCQLYQRNLILLARLLKTTNFILFHAVLPYQAEIEKDIELAHFGLGIVVHPNVKIGTGVKIYHNVTLATETWIGSPYKIVIGNNVIVGAGSAIVGRGDKTLTIGDRAQIGANAVVTGDVKSDSIVAGVPARQINTSRKVGRN